MDMLSDVLGENPEAGAAPAEQANPAPAAEPAAGGPARGPDGKFAAKAEEAPPAAAQAPAAQAADPAASAPGFVPVAALTTERRRAQDAEAELARLRGAQPAPQPQAPPSVFEDEAYTAYQQTQILNVKLDLSEDNARAKHGDADVDRLQAWFAERSKQSPAYYQEVISQRNPYEYAMSRMKREEQLEKIEPDKWAQFEAWQAAQAANLAQSPNPPAAQPAARLPTPSLASASSAGGVQHVPSGPGQAFDAVFKGT